MSRAADQAMLVGAGYGKVEIALIKDGKRLRKKRDFILLAESIAGLGLMHPITVTSDMRLVAGYHRLQACKKLGWEKIPAFVVTLDSLKSRLMEIDENLIRNELDALERGEHLLERKKIYETLNPETKKGVAGARARHGTATDKLSFAKSTAKSMQESPRNIERDIAVIERLSGTIRRAVRETSIANNKQELARLSKLNPDDQKTVVASIVSGAARGVREANRNRIATKIRSEPAPLPGGPYRVIVIDPPWPYEKRKNDPSQRGGLDYPTMSIEDLCEMEIEKLAHKNCILWTWTTNAFMREAYQCLDAWGFKDKTILTWDKGKMGMGDWLRGQTEHCIVAVRGRPTVVLTNQTTLLQAPRREHSRKPEKFYGLVEKLCPGSRLEIFARDRRKGWDAWGGEADKFTLAK